MAVRRRREYSGVASLCTGVSVATTSHEAGGYDCGGGGRSEAHQKAIYMGSLGLHWIFPQSAPV